MKKLITFFFLLLIYFPCRSQIMNSFTSKQTFIKVDGQNLIKPNGEKLLIKGINLGNWLNPEGYMFSFKGANSARLIDQAIREMVGPDAANLFWKEFKDNYVTREDINYIKKTGMNSIRLPFHYKLFTDEDYLGLTNNQDGFSRIDSLVEWCRSAGLYIILDMHDAPGGQTGDNIDDSYGYPWLFTSKESQEKYCEIWKKIANHYKNEPVILGYDLLNEPLAPYFNNMDELNKKLEPIYKMAVKAIREVDKNHIVILGGAQWDGNFKVFNDSKFDSNMMYTCHRYWCDTLQTNLQDLIDFRNKVNLPLYMGETGENTDTWVESFRKLMERNNMGWHFWPYKKLDSKSCMVQIKEPENWELLMKFVDQPRTNFKQIRDARPDQELVKKALNEFIKNSKFKYCTKNEGYIKALGMNP